MTVQYKSNLRKIAAQIDQEMRLARVETGNDIGDLAQDLAPRDTGDLAASKRVREDGDSVIVSFGEGLPDIRAIAQEYGTSKMAAQPYLTPAVEAIDKLFRAKERLNALIAKHRI